MENQFVTYEQSLTLKELGYNKYSWFGMVCSLYEADSKHTFYANGVGDETYISAPLKSQAFEFFREKYGLHSFVDIYPTKQEPNRCWFMIRYIDRSIEEEEDYMSGWFSCQDKAEIYCLDKLIEIVKNK